jgi:hypothetical protein
MKNENIVKFDKLRICRLGNCNFAGIDYALGSRLVVQANSRAQFTAEDFVFVVKVLARCPRDSVGLVELLSDEEERDRILDHDRLYEALIDGATCLQVSPAFYFYVLTRRVLRKAGVDERSLADYVAAVLTFFSRTAQLRAPGTGGADTSSRSFAYICDVLEKLAVAGPDEAYLLRSHLGNYTLFLSGLFAERVAAHAYRRGAPGLSFYESIGQSSFDVMARHPHARQTEMRELYAQMAAEFRVIRKALNLLTETILHFHAEPPGWR